MLDLNRRRLPVGIQSFKKIREGNFVYVDKSDLVWYLVNYGDQYNYLSRPRRFGKSVLVDTLQHYLEGNKELFEGLKIMELEKEWKHHPVIRLDMSRGGATAETIRSYLNIRFKYYEEKYGIDVDPTAQLADRFDAIIVSAYKQTSQPVAVLIDEYDAPLQHSWKTDDHDGCTEAYREVFAILKADDEYECFVFITGITKFTQISLFSVLNNLTNISFEPEYAAICGITEEEIAANFGNEVKKMADVNGWTVEETHARLKDFYDGYHFCRRNSVDIYNPYSLVNALGAQQIRNFWASSGATSLLPKFVTNLEMRLDYFNDCYIDSFTLETSDVVGGGAELFLYQSGYLTMKGYEDGMYHLGFPNEEVKQALNRIVMPALTLRNGEQVISTQNMLTRYMNIANVDEAMKCLQSLIADVPYSNKKMASMDMEERYRLLMSTIFHAIGFSVEVEHMLATGRIDMVVKTSRYIYVLELKLKNNGGKDAAASQIKSNSYLEPFKADSRQVIGLALELDDLGKGILDWKIV